MNPLHVETAVKERYSSGAECCEPALCCPVDYDPQNLTRAGGGDCC